MPHLYFRYGVTFKSIVGEEKSITPEMTAAWKETCLPNIFSKYEFCVIYNADEFGLFYRGLPDKTFHLNYDYEITNIPDR